MTLEPHTRSDRGWTDTAACQASPDVLGTHARDKHGLLVLSLSLKGEIGLENKESQAAFAMFP